jgi:hypothetical protein
MFSTLSRLTTRGVALRLFITCWLIYALHFATNTVREIYPALSLGDHLSFDVSEYLGLHPDLFAMPGRGAFINNNPGASMLGAIPYALTRPIIDPIVARVQAARAQSTQPPPQYNTIYPLSQEFYRKAYARGLDIKFGLAAGAMQVLLMAPLSALSVVVMFYILFSLTTSIQKSLLLALLYAFATPIFYRTAQLNQNLLVSHCALFAFALLWQPWNQSTPLRRSHYLLAGLIAGWAVVLDYSGLVVLGSLGLYALVRYRSFPAAIRTRLDLVSFGLGAIAGVGVLLIYQWAAFGNPIFPAQHYMPATAFSGYGFSGMDLPQLDLLWDTAFGMRFGLFTSAPLLLLALYIPGWLRGSLRIVGERELRFILLYSLAFFLFASASQYGRLQFNSGVRYIVPVVPFLFLLAAGVLLRMPPVLAVIVGIVTTYWSWCLALYRDVEQGFGVFESLIHVTSGEIRLPWLTTLERIGYVSGVPISIALLLLCGILVWFLWRSPSKALQAMRTLP